VIKSKRCFNQTSKNIGCKRVCGTITFIAPMPILGKEGCFIADNKAFSEESAKLTKTIDNTTYTVKVHFSQTSKETLHDKLLRIIEKSEIKCAETAHSK